MAGRNRKKVSKYNKNVEWKAGVYTRRSFDDLEDTESDSIFNQKELISSFLETEENLHIVNYYTDDGYSGTDFNRPGFQKLFKDIVNGNINVIVVKDLSRLGRNYIEVGKYIENIFPIYNVRIISINDGIDSFKNPSSINSIVVPIKNLINDEYAKDISKKVKSAYVTMARNGKYVSGTPPYGYAFDPDDKHKLIINSDEAEIVKLIFEKASKGFGKIKICKYLNGEHILCRKELQRRVKHNIDINDNTIECTYKWGPTTIGRMLSNEVYIGNLVQNKTGSVSYKIHKLVPKPKEEWIRCENTHEPIISKEMFERVQKSIKVKIYSKKKPQKYSIYNGILKCADCNKAMNKQEDHRNNRQVSNFFCSGYLHIDNSCSPHKIKEELLNKLVLDMINIQIKLVNELDKNIKKLKANNLQKKLECDFSYSKNKYLRDIERLKASKRDAYKEWKFDNIDKQQYLLEIKKCDNEIEILTNKITDLKKNFQAEIKTLNENEYWIEHFKNHKKIKQLTREVLKELIENIYVYEDGHIRINFKYSDEYESAISELKEKEEM